MEDNLLYLKRTLVYENEISELDYELYDEFGFDSTTHSRGILIDTDDYDSNAYPVSIDKLIEELTEMKQQGATHVEIQYHTDHIGYVFEGYTIKAMSDTDIEEHNHQMQVERDKERRIAELKKQIRILENSHYGAYPKQNDDFPF